jgi:hypothetical protein
VTEIILLPLIYTFDVSAYEEKALLLAFVSVWRYGLGREGKINSEGGNAKILIRV